MKKFEEIKNYILRSIEDGSFNVYRSIPSERDLAGLFKVNRQTVRQAIDELMYEGVLYKKARSGTYIVTEDHLSTEGDRVYRLLSYKQSDKGIFGSKVLNLSEDENYTRLRRILYLDSSVFRYDDLYFNEKLISIKKPDFEKKLATLLKKDFKTITFDTEVHSFLSLQKVSTILDIELNSPLIQLRKTFYDEEDNIICFSRSYYSAEKFSYKISKQFLD